MTTKFSKNNTTMVSAILVKPNGALTPGGSGSTGMTQVFDTATNQYNNVDAYLELQGTDGGLLFNRMTTAQMLALKAVDGMKVYVTDIVPGFYSYVNGVWGLDGSGGGGGGGITSVIGTYPTNQIKVTTPFAGVASIALAPDCAMQGDITTTGAFVANSSTPPTAALNSESSVKSKTNKKSKSDAPEVTAASEVKALPGVAFYAVSGDYVGVNGNIKVLAGNVQAGTGISTDAGNITASNGQVIAGTGISVTTGDVNVSSTGAVITNAVQPITNAGVLTLGKSTGVVDLLGTAIRVNGTPITAGGTVTSVGVTSASSGLTVTGSPITTSGNIDLTLNTNLQNLSQLNGAGIITSKSPGVYVLRSIAGSANITVANGSGGTNNPTISLASTITATTWNGSVIGVPYGGTGKSTLTNNALLVGNGSSVINQISGGAGTVLTGTAGVPIFSATPIVDSITINNLPITSTDGVNKAYADAINASLDFKSSCRAATTVNLTSSYNNGISGVGATLTNTGALVPLALDGITILLGDRVLIKNQATTFQNGVYTLTTLGTGSIAWVLTRALDYNDTVEITVGNVVPVELGASYSTSSWLQTSAVTTVGTTPIVFVPFTYSPSAFAQVANDLSDLASASTARGNLGITNIATQTVTANNVLVGGGANSIQSIPLTAGQVLVGATSGLPLATTPSSGTNIVSTGGSGALSFNLGTAVVAPGSIKTTTSLEATTTVTAGTGVTVTTGNVNLSASGVVITNTINPLTSNGTVNVGIGTGIVDLLGTSIRINGTPITAGGGNVTGAATTTVGALASWGNTTGTLLDNSSYNIDGNGNLAMGSKRITTVADPIAAQDVATQNFVDTRTINSRFALTCLNSIGAYYGDNTYTLIAFGSHFVVGNRTVYDPSGWWSPTTNSSRITLPTTGYYKINGTVALNGGGGGVSTIRVLKNGTTFPTEFIGYNANSSGNYYCSVSVMYNFNAGDYLEFQAGLFSIGSSKSITWCSVSVEKLS